jgi:phosphomannomutase
VARPSGTEPKVKFYFDVREMPGSGEDVPAARSRAQARIESLKSAFLAEVQAQAQA